LVNRLRTPYELRLTKNVTSCFVLIAALNNHIDTQKHSLPPPSCQVDLAERFGSSAHLIHHDSHVVVVLGDHHGHDGHVLLLDQGRVTTQKLSQAPRPFQSLP
jgi:hypothetical protein